MRALLGIAIGLTCGLLVLESVLRILPTQNGIFAADPDRAWPVHHLRKSSEFTYSSEWNFRNVVRGKTNNFGYVAPFDYRRGERAVVVLGDSYVESMMNAYDETLQAGIARALPAQIAVLNFGMAGSALPDYLGLAELIRQSFYPEWVVIVVTEGDYVGGFAADPGHFQWSRKASGLVTLVPDRERGTLRKRLREIGIVRYARGNLRVSMRDLFDSRPSTETPKCVPGTLDSDDEALIRAYATALANAYGVPAQRLILVIDSENGRRALYDRSAPRSVTCPRRDDLALTKLAAEARHAGMLVIDTMPAFALHYRQTGRKVDRFPHDAHWNAAGHRLAAQAVLDVLCCGDSGAFSFSDPADRPSPAPPLAIESASVQVAGERR